MVCLAGYLSLLNLGDVIDDIIHSLKSYIRGSTKFLGTQHSMISMSIHWFGSGLCTDPQVIIYYYHLLVNLFNFNRFVVKCILYDGIKCFVLIMQGVNHIGITQSGYRMYGKL